MYTQKEQINILLVDARWHAILSLEHKFGVSCKYFYESQGSLKIFECSWDSRFIWIRSYFMKVLKDNFENLWVYWRCVLSLRFLVIFNEFSEILQTFTFLFFEILTKQYDNMVLITIDILLAMGNSMLRVWKTFIFTHLCIDFYSQKL